MRRNLPQIYDAKDYIIVALLLILATSLMIQRFQGGLNSMRKVSLTAFSLIEKPLSNIRVYRRALQTNTYLQRQNILLQDELSRLRSVENENVRLRKLLEFKQRSPFELQPVTITGKELTGTNNMLTVDAGTTQGIKTGMPLITSDGLVGRVILTTDNYAQVMPFYNTLFRVSASILETETYGIVNWPGESLRELEMNFVPQTIEVDSGYVVQTSGFGQQFPKGIPIGTVVRTEPVSGREFQRIYLEPFVSLFEISEGFIVKFIPDSSLLKLDSLAQEAFK